MIKAKNILTNEPIPLVIAFTSNYIIPVATFLKSLLATTQLNDKFVIICLLPELVSPSNQESLEQLAGDWVTFRFIYPSPLLEDIYVDPIYTEAASYRLLLADLLPEYETILYMDCDIIVQNDMAYLFRSVDLGNNYLAAVAEATLDFQEAYIRSLDCEPGQYFNSGVLIMNLKALREDQMTSIFINASKKQGLQFPDQDVLNQYCKGRVLKLAPYYNAIRTFHIPQYKSQFLKYYSASEWDAIQLHGNIHYTGAKPWSSFSIKFDKWWAYYDLLPQAIKDIYPVSTPMYLLSKIYRSAPGRFLIINAQNLYRKLRQI